MRLYADAIGKAEDAGRLEDLNDAMWAEKAMRTTPSDTRYFVGRFEQACKSLGNATDEKREVWMDRVRAIVNEQTAVIR